MTKRQALLIGVAEYESAAFHDLPVVRQDLKLLGAALEQSAFEVNCLGLGAAAEVGRTKIVRQIRQTVQKAKALDTLLIYFSGHGLHYQGRDYLVPADAEADAANYEYLTDELIPVDLVEIVRSGLDGCEAKLVLMVVDACREGVMLEAKAVGLASWGEGQRLKAANCNLAFLFSCESGQYSRYIKGEQGFSLFTKALAEAMGPEVEACTLERVVEATQDRLDVLAEAHGMPEQLVKLACEDDAKRTIGNSVICAGTVPERQVGKTARQSAIFKAGTPMQMPPLPKHFVERPEHSDLVKGMLLCEEPERKGTLVVSAIYGLGGIGKSVMAAALCHDTEVQGRFPDGILWVTLGQQPDLQASLGGWIQALRDFDYKPTTVEAASTHLRTLLHDKQVLLVVDDAWQSEHVVPFQIGGAGCRVLVTTREAEIPNAERHDLDVMKEGQALELLESYGSGAMTTAVQADALAFAKAVGYLPLALELAAVQVGQGFSWAELREEFDREVAELELLDSSEVQNYKHEEKRKRLSLRACFNLSLRRLSREQLAQFSWLGVLPEDVTITTEMAATLWGLSRIRAKKLLVLFKNRALLTAGAALQGEEATYRLHDLMHDTARWLLRQPVREEAPDKTSEQLSGLGLSWAEAQRQFLEKFRAKAEGGLWWTLADDGYIYRYLTWHLEQAGLAEEIHGLLAASDGRGRNAWYEACDKLGDPAIFVQDVARAWRLAEEGFEDDRERSVLLQVRYGLINATMVSLLSGIPGELMAALVRHGLWTPEQAWAYVVQLNNEVERSEAIVVLLPLFPDFLLDLVGQEAERIGDLASRAKVLRELGKQRPGYLDRALEVARRISSVDVRAVELAKFTEQMPSLYLESLELLVSIRDAEFWLAHECKGAWKEQLRVFMQESPERREDVLKKIGLIQDTYHRDNALLELAKQWPGALEEALEFTRSIEGWFERSGALAELSKQLPELFSEALEVARLIQDRYTRARALSKLAKQSPELLDEALEITRSIQDESGRAGMLMRLSKQFPELSREALEITRSIQDEFFRAICLKQWVKQSPNLLEEVLKVTCSMQDDSQRFFLIEDLSKYLPPELLEEALEVTRSVRDESSRATALIELDRWSPVLLREALVKESLEITHSIQNETKRVTVLAALSEHLPPESLEEALEVASSIRDDYNCSRALVALSEHLPPELLKEALEVTSSIQSEFHRAKALTGLARHFPELLQEALSVTRSIQNDPQRVEVLIKLAKQSPELLGEAVSVTHSIQDEYYYSYNLEQLAMHFPSELLQEELEVTRSIQDKSNRATALIGLSKQLPELQEEALAVVRSIQDKSNRATALISLSKQLPELQEEALAVVRSVQNESNRANTLVSLVQHLPSKLRSEVLEVVCLIQDNSSCAIALSGLVEYLDATQLNSGVTVAKAINNPYYQAQAFSAFLPRLPLSRYSPKQLAEILHRQAHRKQGEFMQDIPKIMPALQALGGKDVIHGVVQVMEEVTAQWK